MGAAFDVSPLDGSALALEVRVVGTGTSATLGDNERDCFLFVERGSGSLTLADVAHALEPRSAGLVLAGEEANISAEDELHLVVATVGAEVDLHAPMGRREVVTALDDTDAQKATGGRSFEILFGPHNGSIRATFFAGFIPPGRSPWHYHLYDEIVWIPEGPGRLHLEQREDALGAGSAFRLRPRQVHVVENGGPTEMTIIGVFTPAGSPSAAYLAADVASEYRIAE